MVINENTIENIISQIRTDIFTLRKEGISEKEILISMPNFFKQLLEYYFIRKRFFNNLENQKIFSSCRIVEGYNNQICVFYNNATPNSLFLKPITIEYQNEQQKAN